MRQRKVYKQLVNCVVARNNCIGNGNDDWLSIWESKIEGIERNHLPSGSGFDSGCKIDIDDCHSRKLVITSGCHPMDEYGGYDPWIDFSVVVAPDLLFDIDVKVKGRFGKHQDLKEYIAGLFYDCLMKDIEVD